MKSKVIILAGGSGKRMKSKKQKTLHEIMGKPMLHWIIEACFKAGIQDVIVVVGKGGEDVKASVAGAGYSNVNFVWQHEQLGTGHAVLCAKEYIAPEDEVLVLFGDVPLIQSEFITNLINFRQKNSAKAVVAATTVPNPTGYGRVVTIDTEFEAIVEHRDANSEQLAINLINTGPYLSTGSELLRGLERIENKNDQNEYYLTDVPKLTKEDGHKVLVYNDPDFTQFLGVSSQKQLADINLLMRNRIIDRHYDNGVVIPDPNSVYIEADVEIEAEATILPGTMLYGNTKIAAEAVIGPYSQITDSEIGLQTHVRNSVVESAKLGKNCQVGPFAYLRKDTVAGDNCRIGDFVELKNVTMGNGSKASHLAYIGDAQIGEGVNFGCGAITVNYDGANKHLTVVEDGAFIGSNVNLVAPVVVHEGAFVAAGSTIVQEVPQGALAIARERQVNKEGRAPDLKKK